MPGPDSGTAAKGAPGLGDIISGQPINLYLGGWDLGVPGSSGEMMWRLLIARHGFKAPAAAPKSVIFPNGLAGFSGGVNVGLCDGHVEFCKLPNLWKYYWHALSVPKGLPLMFFHGGVIAEVASKYDSSKIYL